MSPNQSYAIRRSTEEASEISDAATRRIRAAFIVKGDSLRAWVRRWATAVGRDSAATYETTRSTLARCVELGRLPRGKVGRQIVEALEQELGSETVWGKAE